jgi:predicted RNase H-like nuclease (RuvC/YqgF family)
MSHCENIDGQCGASWCNCKQQRKETTMSELKEQIKWRRGDETVDMPHPREIGKALDSLADGAENLERENAELKERVEQLEYERDMFDIEQVIKLKDELWRDNLELKRERLEARQEAIKWQTAWMNKTPEKEMGTKVMPRMVGWEMGAALGTNWRGGEV